MLVTGRGAEAERYLRHLSPDHHVLGAIFALGRLLCRGRPSVANVIACFTDASLSLTTTRSLVRDNVSACAFAAEGNREEARKIVDRILARSPSDVEAQSLKGQLLLSEGRRDEALAAVRAAATAYLTSAEAHSALGVPQTARGETTRCPELVSGRFRE